MSNADKRKRVSDQHEQVITQAFAKYLERTGESVVVLPRPQEASQGDGLLLVGENHLWLEIISIYQNQEEARELWQSVTPGESSPPKRLDLNETIVPRKFHERLIEGIIKKLEKATKGMGYFASKAQWGPGTLIADCRDPLIDLDWPMEQMFIVDALSVRYEEILSFNEKEIFKDLYLYVPVNWTNQRKFIPFLEECFRKKTFSDNYIETLGEDIPT